MIEYESAAISSDKIMIMWEESAIICSEAKNIVYNLLACMAIIMNEAVVTRSIIV